MSSKIIEMNFLLPTFRNNSSNNQINMNNQRMGLQRIHENNRVADRMLINKNVRVFYKFYCPVFVIQCTHILVHSLRTRNLQ